MPDMVKSRFKFYDGLDDGEPGVEIDCHYFIDKDRIDTPHQLLKWMVHLAGKGWMDTEALYRFAEAVGQRYNIEVHKL